jgi:nuclear transport factor 2 (NTF2) superfamily protein
MAITTAWYDTDEAWSLLIKAALGGVEYQNHFKSYAITRDEWYTAEGSVADKLKAIWTQAGEAGIAAEHAGEAGAFDASGFMVSVEAAIEALTMSETSCRSHWFHGGVLPPTSLTELAGVIAPVLARHVARKLAA